MDIKVSDLKKGDVIRCMGESFYVLGTQTHPKHGAEVRALRGRQASALWYSAANVQRWLDQAIGFESLTEVQA